MTFLSCSESASNFLISNNQVLAIIVVRLTTIYITQNAETTFLQPQDIAPS